MKLRDLEAFMVVRLRNGERFFVARGGDDPLLVGIDKHGYLCRIHYNEDMENDISGDYDIVRVWSAPIYEAGYFDPESDGRDIVWERKEKKEPVRVTMERIEEKFGAPIMIVSNLDEEEK